MARIQVPKKGTFTCDSSTAEEAVEYLRQVLDEPAHGNVLLSCGPQKLDPTQQLRECNAEFVFANYSWLSSGPPVHIAATELRGITIEQLSSLLDFIVDIASSWCDAHHLAYGQPLSFEAFNLYHADFWVIGPATAGHGRGGCSYVELVATSAQMQRPLWFVSHAWLEPVCNFVACLKRHASLRQLSEQTAYWVCAYANNQHQLEAEICHNPRKTSFYRAIKMCAGVLLVLDNNATPFTRTVEHHFAAMLERKFLQHRVRSHGRILGSLQILNLSRNALEELPPSLFHEFKPYLWHARRRTLWHARRRNLRDLRVIDLSYNKLSTLDSELFSIPSLRTLDLRGNPLTKATQLDLDPAGGCFRPGQNCVELWMD